MPEFDLLQEVGSFLASCRTASLATVCETGEPYGANVQFAVLEGMVLGWVSSGDSVHSRNIERTGQAAMTVYGHNDRPQGIHGVQLRGRASRIEDASAWNTMWEAYTDRFPFVAVDPEFKMMIEKQAFYLFTPEWMRWIDNRRGFGWKVERDLV